MERLNKEKEELLLLLSDYHPNSSPTKSNAALSPPTPPHSQVEGLVEKEVVESIVREYIKNSITNNATPIVALLKEKEKETSATTKRSIKGAAMMAKNKGGKRPNSPKKK